MSNHRAAATRPPPKAEPPPTIGYYIAIAEVFGWNGAAFALRGIARQIGGIHKPLPFDGPHLLRWMERVERKVAALQQNRPPRVSPERPVAL